MGLRHVLFLDADGLSAWRCRRGQATPVCRFAPDAEGVERFAAFLARQGGVYSMLVDVAEEGFQLEDIPPLRGRDRIALIKRKLARHYPMTPFTVALTLGRQSQGRGDERMLFAALTRPQQLEPWLSALKTAKAAVAGVFSLPQMVTALPGMASGKDRFLLITWTRGGLRQTFVEEGRMRFSRLSAPGCRAPAEAAALCAREAAKIHHYLDGLGLVVADGPLPVRILLHPAQTDAFASVCRNSRELRYEYLDLQAYATRSGLRSAVADSFAEALFVHLLVRKPPRAQFAHADTREAFRLGRIRLLLRATACGVLAAGLSFAAAKVPALRALDQSIGTAQAETAAAERRYRSLLAARPDLPLPPDELLALASGYEELLRRSVGPEATYIRLSAAFDAFPEIGLERLTWTVADDAATTVPAKNGDSGPCSVVDIEATLPMTMVDDLPAQTAAIERFAGRLRADGALDVRLVSAPAEAASAVAVTGDGEAATPAASPRFALRAVHRLGQP